MIQKQIKKQIEQHIDEDGLIETRLDGVKLFRVTSPVRCAPSVYEPCAVAIVSGRKEAILDNTHYVYDANRYLCCPVSMPVEAGTPTSSPDNPLLGVYISLRPRQLTELAIEVERAGATFSRSGGSQLPQSLALAEWDQDFSNALLRLLQLLDNEIDAAVLGEGRLRELYYAILKGEAGETVQRSFGVGNEIARVIEYVSAHLDKNITIEEMADKARMSRAVFHRKFRQATRMSPIQFVKSMRLNAAAMKMASGLAVNQAAFEVGYASMSQFSREFKRSFGCSPRQWQQTQSPILAMA